MLDTGSPLDHEGNALHANVPPLTSHHSSRSSSPGASFFDGTPFHLLPLYTPSPTSSLSASYPHDMARKLSRSPDGTRQEQTAKLKAIQTLVASSGPVDRIHVREDVAEPTVTEPIPSFAQLSTLLRLEKYTTGRFRQVQHHLHYAQITAARSARLALVARSVQRTLAECIKSEDKHSFANLFNAFHDALPGGPAYSGEQDGEILAGSETRLGYPASFVDTLSTSSLGILRVFLARVRSDPSFVADRLSALSHRELVALNPDKSVSRSDESIFGTSERASSRTSRNLGFVVDGQTELLSSYELANPLDVLIHSVRNFSDHNLQNDPTATEVWATACARLIAEQKQGSDKIVPAVIEAWASWSPWPGKDRLELWLLSTLQKGSFILEQPHKQSYRPRVQGRREETPEEDQRQETFYTNAVDSLLRLLADASGVSLIPPGATALCRAIYRKLEGSPRHQRAFPNFVLTRWLFPSFLCDAIITPETHGLLTDYFVSDQARQRILREVAGRCHKTASDVVYAWRLGNVPSEETMSLVRAVAERMHTSEEAWNPSQPAEKEEEHSLVAISASDIQTMVQALYPVPVASSFIEDDASNSGLRSSSSSISGFSLFQSTSNHAASSWENLSVGPALDYPEDKSLTQEKDPFVETPFGAAKAPQRAEFDGDKLRDICSGIDESLSSRRTSTLDHWCFLLKDEAGGKLSMIKDKLPKLPKLNGGTSESRETSHLVKSCRGTIESLIEDGDLVRASALSTGSAPLPEESLLQEVERALSRKIKSCEDSADFVQAHVYFRKARQLRELVAQCHGLSPLTSVLHQIGLDKQDSLDAASVGLNCCDSLFRSVTSCVETHSHDLSIRLDVLRQLRDKMWYVADVRTSAIYDDARAVASTLKTMGKPQRPPRTRSTTSQGWNGPRGSTTNIHLKTETQILDLMTAPLGRGGRGKLGDDQSKALASWMERNTVENLCRGEERLHKLCMEIRKVVDQVASENCPLISSELFAKDRLHSALRNNEAERSSSTLAGHVGRLELLTLRTNVKPSIDAVSSASSHALSTRSSRDYLDSWSPSVSNRSSAPFWSPVTTEARSPSSVTSVGSTNVRGTPNSPAKHRQSVPPRTDYDFIEKLRQRTTGLIVSEIASAIFGNGSETDQAFWTGLGGEVTEKYLYDMRSGNLQQRGEASDFDFENAFEKLVTRFSTSSNPYGKLAILLDIDILLLPYVVNTRSSAEPAISPQNATKNGINKPLSSEVTDVKVEGFRMLFCKKATRPAAIFRDLQYIAALVPSKILETTPQGKAFWNAAVAILGLKKELCSVMVETADSIIAHHSNKRGHGRTSSVAQQQRDSAAFSVPNRTPSPEDIRGRGISDAALLLQITAKEGNAVAQRELATLYLTDPELMDHIIAPLARPRDVFKEELESKWRKNQDPTRCDPTTMCVAHHWMSLSSRGGDALATEFLRQREEMERLP